LAGLVGREISPSQGQYPHKTAQHRKTRTNFHALRGIQTRDLNVQTINAFASDRAPTGTGVSRFLNCNFSCSQGPSPSWGQG